MGGLVSNLVGFARMTAVEEGVPVRKEAAEHAVLGVEHGQMLVQDHLGTLIRGLIEYVDSTKEYINDV